MFTDNPFRNPNIDPETAKRLDVRNAAYNWGNPGPNFDTGEHTESTLEREFTLPMPVNSAYQEI